MKSTRRIALLLTLVFLLPALFFSVYELSSLDKDEKMIQDIYSKQLEAILFSVNQYSDDILGNWVSRIEASIDNSVQRDSTPAKIKDMLNLNSSLKGIFVSDTIDGSPQLNIYSLDKSFQSAVSEQVTAALKNSRSDIEKLFSLKKSGFQKIQRLNVKQSVANTFHCLVFITQTNNKRFQVAGLFIDADLFIEDIVGPRLQTIAKDQFILSALVKNSNSVVYATSTTGNEVSTAEALTKDFWIFPDYALGIRTKGTTLQQLVRERTKINFTMLITLDVILITAVVLVFRNLKKEVNLAQNKADFVSNVSHEIRTPLALISMFAETLEMNRVATEEKKQEYYRIISKETQRLTGIVNKILNFSQTEAKKKPLHIEMLNLNKELHEILATYDFHLSNKGFKYTLSGQEEMWIKADREALIESIINLIDNAMKYSEDQKSIEITTGYDGDYAFVAVKDFGVGISKQHQKHIFDKFYRVPKGNLARSRGTGLGLSLVKQLMEAQRGKITVSSEPGVGSTFTLYFPI